jgi:hypothetical protein
MCGAMEADPFEQPYWNLDQYLIWLASRDPAAVLGATDRPNSGANPPIGWRVHRESNADRKKVEMMAVQAMKGGHIKARVRFNRKWFTPDDPEWFVDWIIECEGEFAAFLTRMTKHEWRQKVRLRKWFTPDDPFADWVIAFESEPTFAAFLMRTTKHGRREKVRPRFDPQSTAQLYPAPSPSNIRDQPDLENPDVGPFIAYHDAMYWLAERISLQEFLSIDEASSRAEKNIKDICKNTPEKLTMWGFRKTDPDAELKPITPQAWQGLSINPLAGQPETDLKAVGRRREYGVATEGECGPSIWTGLCFNRKQFVAAFVTGGGNRPRGTRPKADWPAIEEAFRREVAKRGMPDETNVDSWQRQADVERWLGDILIREGVESISEATLRRRARGFLSRAREGS